MTDDKRWQGGYGRNWKGKTYPKAVRRGQHRCPVCRGRGSLPGMTKVQGMGTGMGSDFGPCYECGGSGWLGEPETQGNGPTDGSVE